MEFLPTELCLHLLQYLPAKDLANSCRVNRFWQSVCDDEAEWKSRCQKDWWIMRRVGREAAQTWKATYGQRFVRWRQVSSMKLTRRYIQNDLIEMPEGDLSVRYISDQDDEDDTVGAAISDRPLMPLPFGDVPACAYFEMTVVNAGEHGYVAIGLAADGFPIARSQPGWRKASVGYHGDDGDLYAGSGFGSHYAETYTTNNTVGCVFDLVTREVTFVRQGQPLETVTPPGFEKTDIAIFAACGTHSKDEHVKLNFGAEPFDFNIAPCIEELLLRETDEAKLLSKQKALDEILERLESYTSNVNEEDPENIWTEEETPFTDLLADLSAPNASQDERLVNIVRGMLHQVGWPSENIDGATPEVLIGLGKAVVFGLAQQEQGLGSSGSSDDDDDDDDSDDSDDDSDDDEDDF
eukprot:TRINITY_DN15861_c0_g1_i1.p1 TRINITY_DN15861_c0_g1~~TRINITY_DN15861_c0_g1_i1.p1  ORF type:complete len:409 (-),score=79.14 TRINITY_DN15861_c0_g1_i1:111-1337(-)